MRTAPAGTTWPGAPVIVTRVHSIGSAERTLRRRRTAGKVGIAGGRNADVEARCAGAAMRAVADVKAELT